METANTTIDYKNLESSFEMQVKKLTKKISKNFSSKSELLTFYYHLDIKPDHMVLI